MDSEAILAILEKQYPNAKCELEYRNPFELLVAVVLSAQTTDVAVNKITRALFERFSTCVEMAEAPLSEIEALIKTIGLYRNKARSLQMLSSRLVDAYNGVVPNTRAQLITLAGVGRKTANVVLSEIYHVPSIAVDTHVERISKRIGLAKDSDSVEQVEQKLCRKIARSKWNRAHHLFIFFGRYQCFARNPKCHNCEFINICREHKNRP